MDMSKIVDDMKSLNVKEINELFVILKEEDEVGVPSPMEGWGRYFEHYDKKELFDEIIYTFEEMEKTLYELNTAQRGRYIIKGTDFNALVSKLKELDVLLKRHITAIQNIEVDG